MKNFCVQFCGALKAFRAKAGKGQIAFAKELGLSQPVYARYEKGDREPTLNELIRIAQILHTTPNVLLGFEPPPLRASASPREIPSVNTGDIKGNGNIVGSSSHNTIINAGGGCVIIIVNHQERQKEMTTPKKTFIIRKQQAPLNPQFAARRLADSLDDEQQRSNDKQGCIWMLVGFLLGPVGLIIAAIFGRVRGAIAALVGLAIWAVLWLSGIISFVLKHI